MFDNKSILVTGGTGSFGKHFIEEIITKYNPKRVIIFSRDEYKQFIMKKYFLEKYTTEQNKKLRFFIGDVRDKGRLYRAFKGVEYVVHAAAMKQVPACEYNPIEAVKTNIHGAMNIIDAAIDCGVEKVIALSTDKAVNPINLYGGTKLVSDKIFIAGNSYKGSEGTIFSVVRYGNVAGSRGSVIPFFKNIVENGGDSLPVTDVRMTRFWMTLDKAVLAVVKAFEEARGGETFVYKNPSFKITELAKALTNEIPIKEVGIREGEKLHEIMVTKEDAMLTYDYGDYYVIYPHFNWWSYDKDLIPGGEKVAEGFEYSSDNNIEWIEEECLKKILKNF